MNKKDLLEKLAKHGCAAATDKALSLTSKIIIGMVDGQHVVAVGGDEDAKIQICAFLDAVYWHYLMPSLLVEPPAPLLAPLANPYRRDHCERRPASTQAARPTSSFCATPNHASKCPTIGRRLILC